MSHRIALKVVKIPCEGECLWFILILGEKTDPQKLNLSVHALKIGYWGCGGGSLSKGSSVKGGLGEGVKLGERGFC